MFQERDYLLANGHQVIDFAMQDPRNFLSQYADYFVSNRNYQQNKASKPSKIADVISFVHSTEAVRNINRLIQDTKPDVVHCHNIYHQLTPSIIGAAKKLGVPVVLTLHDYKPVCPTYNRLQQGKPCSKCLNGNFSHVLLNRCADDSLGKSAVLYLEAQIQKWLGNYEQVDTFIAPSQFMQESIAHRIPPKRIKQLTNGVDVQAITVNHIDEGYALYIGRLVPEKGVETLLKAHANSTLSWSLKVAGTGPLLNVLKAQYNPSIFVGHLTGDALKKIIAQAAVVVVPSEWFENCPMSVLEAMAYGKPVVGSRMGGIPELVVDEITGLLFTAGDVNDLTAKLDRLMTKSTLRKQMGAAARLHVTHNFSLDKHNAGLIDIYKNVIGV